MFRTGSFFVLLMTRDKKLEISTEDEKKSIYLYIVRASDGDANQTKIAYDKNYL